jgi:hypothetical protein
MGVTDMSTSIFTELMVAGLLVWVAIVATMLPF